MRVLGSIPALGVGWGEENVACPSPLVLLSVSSLQACGIGRNLYTSELGHRGAQQVLSQALAVWCVQFMS
jgi:hypothetical protein